MGKDKKHFDETLQEARTKNHNKLRFLKRRQEDDEAEKQLKDFNFKKREEDRDEDR